MDKFHKLLQDYVNAGADFAESVKDNIVHNGIITDETVVKLNNFIIAANAIADLTEELDSINDNEKNRKLN